MHTTEKKRQSSSDITRATFTLSRAELAQIEHLRKEFGRNNLLLSRSELIRLALLSLTECVSQPKRVEPFALARALTRYKPGRPRISIS